MIPMNRFKIQSLSKPRNASKEESESGFRESIDAEHV